MAGYESFTFYNRAEYFAQLALDVSRTKAGGRIALASMGFDPTEPLVGDLMHELSGAAERGVDVQMSVDAFGFMTDEQNSIIGFTGLNTKLVPPKQKLYVPRYKALEDLKQHGGHYAVTNQPTLPFSPIFVGRSHIKAAVVNNKVYLGGCELHTPQELDVMVGWDDARAAGWVFDILKSIVAKGSVRDALGDKDLAFTINKHTKLFLDVGVPGQSIIYDKALKLIDKANKHIAMTCQFLPGGKTGKRLKAAYGRGTDVQIYFSHASAHGGIAALSRKAQELRERARLPADFFAMQMPPEAPMLHAKIICTENGAMTGSHNYVAEGVKFGTAEIALWSNSPAFSHALETWLKRQIKPWQ